MDGRINNNSKLIPYLAALLHSYLASVAHKPFKRHKKISTARMMNFALPASNDFRNRHHFRHINPGQVQHTHPCPQSLQGDLCCPLIAAYANYDLRLDHVPQENETYAK
jgi:hypothetical protein